MSGFKGPDDWSEWPPEEQRSEDRYDLGIRDGYGIREMSLVEVDGGIRLTLSEGRDFVGKTLSPVMARRIGIWLLDHAGHEPKQGEERDDGRMCWMVSCDAGSLQMHNSIRAARRLAQFILDNTEGEKQVPDGCSDPDPSRSEGETGKREEGPKEEHMEAMRREAEQLFKQWEKTRRLL
ncbi:hypothetical protein [Bifidobacterium sp. B4142]|uniref:hypothetical protein n=1 Tax=Bifidobacterium sp. B4142 TaxID=2817962 RepID=UPI00226B7D95|nr:hypothetical protein [Bifidobacterium sp. B4142]MCX8687013.1 hypothetical protein [Bifidobacterium sp. B4142]